MTRVWFVPSSQMRLIISRSTGSRGGQGGGGEDGEKEGRGDGPARRCHVHRFSYPTLSTTDPEPAQGGCI